MSVLTQKSYVMFSTIVGKTADLIVVLQMAADTLHRRVSHERPLLKKPTVQKAVSN